MDVYDTNTQSSTSTSASLGPSSLLSAYASPSGGGVLEQVTPCGSGHGTQNVPPHVHQLRADVHKSAHQELCSKV